MTRPGLAFRISGASPGLAIAVSPCHYDPPYGLGLGVAAGHALATPSTVVPPVCQRSPLGRRGSGARKPSSARGPAIPNLGNPAHVRNSGLTCATGDPHTRQLVDTQDTLEATRCRTRMIGHRPWGSHTRPKCRPPRRKNGKNGLLWVRWSAIWANPGTRQTRPPTTATFPRNTTDKSPPQQHDVSILRLIGHVVLLGSHLACLGTPFSSARGPAIPSLACLIRTWTRYSEPGQPRPHAEQAARVRNSRLARGTGG